jgi:Asp-tRNA(Asn)/Glu-tRNA(Gln) amidotransferase A subunit family amidase
MQIMARHFEEPLLLELALALERTYPWPLTTP